VRLPATLAEQHDAVALTTPDVPADAACVLVIDDDATARALLRRHLTKAGYRVEEAADGRTGLERARDLRPRAITLDVMMPGMDGWAVLAALKADPLVAHIPVVMATILDERRLGFSLGASDYLTKPIDQKRLLAAVERGWREDEAEALMTEIHGLVAAGTPHAG
jgi:CheY-like chemotaxis protein